MPPGAACEGLAPYLSNTLATSKLPLIHVSWSGVNPALSLQLGWQLSVSRHQAATSGYPSRAAR